LYKNLESTFFGNKSVEDKFKGDPNKAGAKNQSKK